ncbi:MAG: O-antigen ligase family protein [Desulfobacterales bacterium]|nr:O-antigen ligase family protein [Desulfobacterales bacterium]
MPDESKIDKIVHAGLIFLLIFTPLAFGSVHVWAYTLLELTVFALLLLSVSVRLFHVLRPTNSPHTTYPVRDSGRVSWISTPLNTVILLFVLIVLFQLIPLPGFLIRFISPNTADITESTRQALVAPNDVIGKGFGALSLYAYPTRNDLLKVLAYAAIFFLLIHHTRNRTRVNSLIITIILTGSFLSLYGLFEKLSGHNHIWWWKNAWHASGFRVFGTFINPDHFAFYLGLVIPLAFGFLYGMKTNRHGRRLVKKETTLWQRFWGPLIEQEAGTQKRILLAFSVGIMLLTLIFTGSRAAIFSLATAFVFMATAVFLKTRKRHFAFLIGLACVIAFFYGYRIGFEPVVERFKALTFARLTMEGRLRYLQATLPIIAAFPVTGTGLGTFKYIYPKYNPEGFPYGLSHLHNDWIELLAETGFVGLAVVMVGIAWLFGNLFRLWWARNDPYAVGIGIGALGAVCSASVHSLFDYSLHMPANAVLLGVLVAIGFLALHSRRHPSDSPFFFQYRNIRISRAFFVSVLVLAAALILCVMNIVTDYFMAEANCATAVNSTLNRDKTPPLSQIKRAIDYDPANAEYYDKLARYYIRLPVKSKELRAKSNEEVIKNLETATSLNPVNGLYWYDLGLRYSYKVYEGAEYFLKWLPRADKAFELADYFRPNDPYMLYNIGCYWVWRSSTLPEGQGQGAEVGGRRSKVKSQWSVISDQWSREEGIKKFQALFKRTLAIDNRYWQRAAQSIWKYYADEQLILAMVPQGHEGLKNRLQAWIRKQKK